MIFKRSLIIGLLICSFFQGAFCATVQTDYAQMSLDFQSGSTSRAGELILELHMEDGWYTYWKDPGDLGAPLSIEWALPEGVSVGDMEWPDYDSVVSNELLTRRVTDRSQWRIPVELNGANSNNFLIKARVNYLACTDDICIPQTIDIQYSGGLLSGYQNGFFFLSGSFWLALSFAFLGGLILNGMPCVFPVISLKLLALVKKSQKSKQEIWGQGIGYTLGIIFTFIFLGSMVSILQKTGHIVGWGFQLQSPVFILILIYLLWLIGLNLSGLVEWPRFLLTIPGKIAGLVTGHHQNDDFVASVFTGVLASILATPCTAPLMAPAIAYGLTQPPIVTVSVFFMLGLGMAFPFLGVCCFPLLMSFFPSPGPWMKRFKELLALPIYGAVFWLFWVLSKQVSSLPYNLTLFSLGGFVLFILIRNKHSFGKRVIVLTMVILFSGVLLIMPKNGSNLSSDLTVQESLKTIDLLRGQKRAVFVDVTASWCLSCKVNDTLVLKSPKIQSLFKEQDITFITLDWTNQSDEITQYLLQFNRNGVPLYVFYPKTGGAMVLPQILSKSIVIKTIRSD